MWKNTIMDTFLDILKYILPSLVVFATAYFLIKAMLNNSEKRLKAEIENQQKQKLLELKMGNRENTLPLKLQAYERLILFLERINPTSLVLRVNRPGASISQMQSILVQNIRDEFEHNMAQQLYVSPEAWKQVKMAKDEVVKMINTAALSQAEGAHLQEFYNKIFELAVGYNPFPTEQAIAFIKKEVQDTILA